MHSFLLSLIIVGITKNCKINGYANLSSAQLPWSPTMRQSLLLQWLVFSF